MSKKQHRLPLQGGDGTSPHKMKLSTLKAIAVELETARRQFPTNTNLVDTLERKTRLLQRVLYLYDKKAETVSAVDIYMVAVVCAVLAIRIIEEGDANYSYRDYEARFNLAAQVEALDADSLLPPKRKR